MKRNVHFSTEGYKVDVAHVLAQIAMGVCKIHHSATRNGYVSRRPNADGTIGEAYTYAGRYGVGYILHLPLDGVTRWYAVQYVTFEPDCMTPVVGVDNPNRVFSVSMNEYVVAASLANACNSVHSNSVHNSHSWRVGVLADIVNPFHQYGFCVFNADASVWDARSCMYTVAQLITHSEYVEGAISNAD